MLSSPVKISSLRRYRIQSNSLMLSGLLHICVAFLLQIICHVKSCSQLITPFANWHNSIISFFPTESSADTQWQRGPNRNPLLWQYFNCCHNNELKFLSLQLIRYTEIDTYYLIYMSKDTYLIYVPLFNAKTLYSKDFLLDFSVFLNLQLRHNKKPKQIKAITSNIY